MELLKLLVVNAKQEHFGLHLLIPRMDLTKQLRPLNLLQLVLVRWEDLRSYQNLNYIKKPASIIS